MRKFIVSLFSVFSAFVAVSAQNPISYSSVEKVEGVPATELFSRAKKWVAVSFVSANDVVQMSDNNTVVIKANHIYDAMSAHHTLDYTMTIECRDGRYKWTIDRYIYSCRWMTNPKVFEFGVLTDSETNTIHSGFFGGKKCNAFWSLAKEESVKAKDILSQSLSQSMNTAAQSSEDNW